MRRPRFRIRTLMIAVAVVAIMVGAGIGGNRFYDSSKFYRSKAVWAGNLEKSSRDAAFAHTLSFGIHGEHATKAIRRRLEWAIEEYPDTIDLIDALLDQLAEENEAELRIHEDAQLFTRKAEHFANLKQKYERAARYPWLPVAPDPPEPE